MRYSSGGAADSSKTAARRKMAISCVPSYEGGFREKLVGALARVTNSLGSASPETTRAIATYFEKRFHQPWSRFDLIWTLAVIDSPAARAALQRFIDRAKAKRSPKLPPEGPPPAWPSSLQEYRRSSGKIPHAKRYALAVRYARAALKRNKGTK